MTAPKFKTGDVVKCIRVDNSAFSHYRGKLTCGKDYTVVRSRHDGNNDLVQVNGDDGYVTEAFASRFTLVPVAQAGVGFRDGDIVRCVNPGVYSLTNGRFYLVRNAYTSGTDKFVTVTDDTGATANAFASRFVFHSRSTPFNRAPTTSAIEKARAERKAAEVARKEKGRARADARKAELLKQKAAADYSELERQVMSWMVSPYGGLRHPKPAPVKKPLLFTSLTEEDVYAALSTYLRAKLPIGLRVVDMDKTTEGFKLTLGVPA